MSTSSYITFLSSWYLYAQLYTDTDTYNRHQYGFDLSNIGVGRATCSTDWPEYILVLRIYTLIGREVEAATTAIVRKVSKLRVWGLGRLTGFCNPDMQLKFV